MKTPNFRLYDVQAKTSVLLGVLAVLSILALAVFVFWGFSAEDSRIYFNAQRGWGKWRPWIVLGASGVGFLIGNAAGLMGFNSLGQKRNNRQGCSWFGVLTGALSIVAAIVLFATWRLLNEPIITG